MLQEVNHALVPDEQTSLFGGQFSGDGSAIVYETRTGGGGSPRLVWVVDRDDLGAPELVDDDALDVRVLQHVPAG